MHSHHHCSCDHEHVRFCKKCQRPYCLDCGKEWYPQQYTWVYPSTSYYTVDTDTPSSWTTTTSGSVCTHY